MSAELAKLLLESNGVKIKEELISPNRNNEMIRFEEYLKSNRGHRIKRIDMENFAPIFIDEMGNELPGFKI